MTEFLTDHGVIVAVFCALIAVAYGVLTTTQLLALSPGNDEMQRIAAAPGLSPDVTEVVTRTLAD